MANRAGESGCCESLAYGYFYGGGGEIDKFHIHFVGVMQNYTIFALWFKDNKYLVNNHIGVICRSTNNT